MAGCPRHLLSAAIALLLATATFGPAAEPREDREPPQLFLLESGSKPLLIELDRPFSIDALGGSKSATLRVKPYRVFQFGGVYFHYPREYTFEADLASPFLSTWKLSGNHCSIMVERFNNKQDTEAVLRFVLEELASEYKNFNFRARERGATLQLKDATLEGRRIELEMAGTAFFQDIYCLPAGKHSIVLVLQKPLDDDGKPRADSVRAEKMLRDTLKLPRR